MGAEWDRDDSNVGSGAKPKVILAGRLDGSVDGRPMSVVAADREIIVDVGSLRTLFLISRIWPVIFKPLQSFLRQYDIRLAVRLNWFGRIEVFPVQSFLMRLWLLRQSS